MIRYRQAWFTSVNHIILANQGWVIRYRQAWLTSVNQIMLANQGWVIRVSGENKVLEVGVGIDRRGPAAVGTAEERAEVHAVDVDGGFGPQHQVPPLVHLLAVHKHLDISVPLSDVVEVDVLRHVLPLVELEVPLAPPQRVALQGEALHVRTVAEAAGLLGWREVDIHLPPRPVPPHEARGEAVI
eukprot:GHVL01023381.1.p2 GENE.GHVL01023381.1~~GHVL01023381.1.p2  ORF type:complete len:185 (-),score=9.31 GHVL01023381.1:519-1073(-)